MKAYRRRRGITTIILKLGTWQRWVVNLLLSHCTSGEGVCSAHATGGWVGPRAGLVILGRKIYFPTGNPSPDHPARSLVTILTVLPQWQESGGTALNYLFSKDWESGFFWNAANHLPECVESFTCRSQFKSYKPKIHKTWTLVIANCVLFLWVTVMSELTTVPSTTFQAACKLVNDFYGDSFQFQPPVLSELFYVHIYLLCFLLCSQEPTTGAYPKPDQSSLHLHGIFI